MGHVNWIGKQNIKILTEKQVSHLVLAGLHSVFLNGIFGGMVLPQLSGLPRLHPSCENFELPTQHTSQENTKQRQSQRDRNLPCLPEIRATRSASILPTTSPPLLSRHRGLIFSKTGASPVFHTSPTCLVSSPKLPAY